MFVCSIIPKRHLKIDENGKVVGRNRGIRGWLRDNMPEL
jgi:hypothetical protein